MLIACIRCSTTVPSVPIRGTGHRRPEMEHLAPPKEKHGLLLYLIVANLWTWVLWIPPVLIATREGYVLPSPDQYARLAAEGFSGSRHVTLALMFSLAVYGPLIGALLALAVEEGLSGVRALLANTLHMRIAPRWYLVAFSIAAAIAFIPTLIAWLTGSLSQRILDVGTVALLFVPLLALQLLTSGLGEEPGWRGYLLPRLQRRLSAEGTVWVLGLVLAIWHYSLT